MFPITFTVHNQAQLSAVLMALAPVDSLAAQHAQETAAAATFPDKDQPVWPHPTRVTPETAAAPAGKPSSTTAKPETRPALSSPTAEAAVAAAPAQSTAPAAPQPDTVPAATVSSAAESVTYDQVARAITASVKVNREHTIDTLAKFGARKGPELKPAQYAAFLAALAQPEAVPA
jgi:hypothetical protein